ncbi:MAG: hypothetical protein SCH71_00140 [Desulfobulbaceae bacterium]|nr:hypothetical protein [Desulfobulbaceae bacterium]
MDFKFHLEKSWNTFTAFLPALLISTLALIGISIVTLGILAPVCTAGYVQSLLQAIRDNRKPEVGDLFSQMKLFLPLLAFTVLVVLVVMLGLAMLVLPGIAAVIALAFFCLYMLPLMTDRNMGLIDAVKESSSMALQKPVVDHAVVVALYLGITALGQSVIFGMLFTQPFATLFILSAFLERNNPEIAPEPDKMTTPPPPDSATAPPESPPVSEDKENVT